MNLTDEQLARFWSHVDVRGPDDCWEWTAYRTAQGYGRWAPARGMRAEGAHRVTLSLHLGRDLAPGMWSLHHCDNPPCVNPAHLHEGDVMDNTRDKLARRRHLYGERINTAKLTPEQVAEIRRRANSGESSTPIAREFGVSGTHVRALANGRHWKHLGDAA